jgi:DNA repair exonuclease SbcCD nuclease subunit
MAIRFAHMADVHLGAFRDDRLRELNLRAFEEALDICAGEDLDFILICGDLFHVNLPEMAIVERAVRKIRELKDAGMRIYLIYGSHDYSALGSSLIDVLGSAALFTKITQARTEEGDGKGDKAGEELYLDFIEDETGALLCGMPGRKSSLEKRYFEMLQTKPLEERKGFKVFAFHSGITEFRPDYLPEGDSIPLSLFPKGFDYYAGGHIHERFEKEEKGYGLITYPGTLFGYDYMDLERGSRNPRGFYVVEHDPDTKRTTAEFKEVKVANTRVVDVDTEGLDPSEANKELREVVGGVDANESVVLLKVHGKLNSGRASDVAIGEVREALDQGGASAVFINRNQLRGADIEKIRVEIGPRDDIENKLFTEYLGSFGSRDPRFEGEAGLKLCRELLDIVRVPKAEGTTKADHNKILLKKATPLINKVPKAKGGDA